VTHPDPDDQPAISAVPTAPPGPYPPGCVPPGYLPAVNAYYGPHPPPWQPVWPGWSDKTRVAAGLLQLLPGFLAIGGIGRLYAGHSGLGAAQLVVSVAAWILFVCGFWLVFPMVLSFGLAVWFVVDGLVLLVGSDARDGYGRPLR
jgi:hypothetical protein